MRVLDKIKKFQNLCWTLQLLAFVAQLVERITSKQNIVDLNPTKGALFSI